MPKPKLKKCPWCGRSHKTVSKARNCYYRRNKSQFKWTKQDIGV